MYQDVREPLHFETLRRVLFGEEGSVHLVRHHLHTKLPATAERRGKTLNGFKDFYVKAKARIWPWLPYICHICSIVAGSGEHLVHQVFT